MKIESVAAEVLTKVVNDEYVGFLDCRKSFQCRCVQQQRSGGYLQDDGQS